MSESASAERTRLQAQASPPAVRPPVRTLRHRLYEILEIHDPSDPITHYTGLVIVTLIAVNVAAFIASTVDSITAEYARGLSRIEAVTVAGFAVEYAARLWVCVQNPIYARPLRGRFRYARTPFAVIDLIAIVPFFLMSPGGGAGIVRIVRIVRLAKLWRYSKSLQLLGRAAASKSEELLVSTALMLIALLIASTLLYYAEHEAQPNIFSSVPASMWWGIATLSTVGYGDIYPVTPLGKVLAGVFAFLGIATFALPIAILSAAFADEFERVKKKELDSVCPHCGHKID